MEDGEIDFDFPETWSEAEISASFIWALDPSEDDPVYEEVDRILWASGLSRKIPNQFAGIDWSEVV